MYNCLLSILHSSLLQIKTRYLSLSDFSGQHSLQVDQNNQLSFEAINYFLICGGWSLISVDSPSLVLSFCVLNPVTDSGHIFYNKYDLFNQTKNYTTFLRAKQKQINDVHDSLKIHSIFTQELKACENISDPFWNSHSFWFYFKRECQDNFTTKMPIVLWLQYV